MGLLTGDLKELIGTALDFAMIDLTLLSRTAGTYNPVTDSDTSTTTNVGCRGFVEGYSDEAIGRSQGLIKSSDRKITILAKSLNGTVPKISDRITAENVTYQILDVNRDPASATYTIQART